MYLITYKYTKKFYLREKSAVKDFPLYNKIRTEVFNNYAHFAKSIKNTGSSKKNMRTPHFYFFKVPKKFYVQNFGLL